jgi:RNA polymerase sigma factor for flagellar operon FliA
VEKGEIMPMPHSIAESDAKTWVHILNESLPSIKFLAGRLARRLPSHVDADDLIQAGIIGLLRSAERFDSERGVKFQTYANRRIEGAMLDYLRELDWRPRSVRSRCRSVEKAYVDVSQRLGSEPEREDVAQELGVDVWELERWMQEAGEGSPVAAPQDEWHEMHSGEYLARLADPADSPEAALAKRQMNEALVRAIDRLPERERLILSLYYYEELTMEEIGKVLGVKQARISQLHARAVERLRRSLSPASRCDRAREMNAPAVRTPASASLPLMQTA